MVIVIGIAGCFFRFCYCFLSTFHDRLDAWFQVLLLPNPPWIAVPPQCAGSAHVVGAGCAVYKVARFSVGMFFVKTCCPSRMHRVQHVWVYLGVIGLHWISRGDEVGASKSCTRSRSTGEPQNLQSSKTRAKTTLLALPLLLVFPQLIVAPP